MNKIPSDKEILHEWGRDKELQTEFISYENFHYFKKNEHKISWIIGWADLEKILEILKTTQYKKLNIVKQYLYQQHSKGGKKSKRCSPWNWDALEHDVEKINSIKQNALKNIKDLARQIKKTTTHPYKTASVETITRHLRKLINKPVI